MNDQTSKIKSVIFLNVNTIIAKYHLYNESFIYFVLGCASDIFRLI